MPLAEGALAAIISGAATAASGAAQGIGTSVKNKRGFKYTKKLMAKQQEYNERNFELQNERQDALIRNSPVLNKAGLKAAGYSAADPNGTGFSPMQAPMPDSPSGQQYDNSAVDVSELSKLALIGSQIRNINADTSKKESETEKINNDLKVFAETYQEQIGKVKSEYYKLTKENRLTDAQIDKVNEEINQICAATAQIKVDTKFANETFDKRKEQLIEQVDGLLKDNRIKEAEAKLADNGILLGENVLQTLMSIASNEKGAEVTKMLGDMLGQVLGAVPAAIVSVIRGILHL